MAPDGRATVGARYRAAMADALGDLDATGLAELETALYRIAQEALTNVARHARAGRVRVALTAMGGELRLEIEDDGIGLAARNGATPPTGTGLVGIRERVRALGGQLTLHGERGMRLEVRVPLPGGG